MPSVPKKVARRFNRAVSKFQEVLEIAKAKDLNEADTVAIVTDIFAEVLGYDKYLEITSEFSIRNTYCDLAVKFGDKVEFLIEVKAIGTALRENHLRQAIDYGANHGVPWVILTNGVEWSLYRIKFERPIGCDLVSSFDFLKLNPKSEKDQEILFLIAKEGVNKEARDDFYMKVQSVNRFVLGALVLSDPILAKLRSLLKKLSRGIKVDTPEIETLLMNEVLKRDIIDGDEAKKASGLVQRLQKKRTRRSSTSSGQTVMEPLPEEPSADAAENIHDS